MSFCSLTDDLLAKDDFESDLGISFQLRIDFFSLGFKFYLGFPIPDPILVNAIIYWELTSNSTTFSIILEYIFLLCIYTHTSRYFRI